MICIPLLLTNIMVIFKDFPRHLYMGAHVNRIANSLVYVRAQHHKNASSSDIKHVFIFAEIWHYNKGTFSFEKIDMIER